MLYPLPPDRYSFVHRSFLEYFCAWEIVWQFKETQQLDFAELRELFMRHWPDPSWHEILRLICGLLEAQFVGQLIEVLQVQEGESVQFAHLFLAARCLGEVRNRAKLDQNLTLLTQIQALVHYQREPLYQFQPEFPSEFSSEFPSNSQPTRPDHFSDFLSNELSQNYDCSLLISCLLYHPGIQSKKRLIFFRIDLLI